MPGKVSIKEVAKMAGVSPGTVSNFLNNSAPVNKATRERIQQAISDLKYRRNEIASSLRRASTKTIGLVLPDIRNPFYAELYYSAENESVNRGYNILLGSSGYSIEKQAESIEILANRQVDGIVVSTNYTPGLEKGLTDIGLPLVVLESSVNRHVFSSIGTDNINGSFQIVNYLIRQGHKKIAIITPSKKSERYIGYEKAMKNAGLEIMKNNIMEFGFLTQDLFTQGYHAMGKLLEKGDFTACFIISDMLAIGAISAAKNKGYQIPEDIAVAGYDNIPFARVTEPALTTMEQPVKKISAAAVEICIDMIENKDNKNIESRVYKSKIIRRQSA